MPILASDVRRSADYLVHELSRDRIEFIGSKYAQQLVNELKHSLSDASWRQLHATLDKLKGTQLQLVQSEKMASLGQLTAGIAHEIQNPLNFVNNFSEISSELLEEMIEEIEKGENPIENQ